MHFDIGIAALVFGIILLAELPDKSMFATLVLGSRLPAFYVWLGAATAFLVQVIIAVAAGKLLTLLPHRIMELIIAALFFGGSMLLFFGKHGLEGDSNPKTPESHNPLKVFATAFGIIFIGEWGDITQIATANYAAKYHAPLSVGIGAALGLWTAAGLAIVAGNKVLNLIPAKILLRFMGVIMLVFAALSLISAFK